MGGVLVDLSTVYQGFSWRRRSFPFLLLSRRNGRVSSGGSSCRGELTAKSRLLLKKLFFLCCFCETAGFNREQVDLGLLTQLVLLSILLHNFPLLFPLFIEHLFPLHPRPSAAAASCSQGLSSQKYPEPQRVLQSLQRAPSRRLFAKEVQRRRLSPGAGWGGGAPLRQVSSDSLARSRTSTPVSHTEPDQSAIRVGYDSVA